METEAVISPKIVWTGHVLSTLVALFLLMDSLMKFLKLPQVIEVCTKLGLPDELIIPLGIICVICTLLYVIPRTAVLGVVLLTGYLGGAVATHLRVGDPLFSHVLFPVYLGTIAWAGLYLRDSRVRHLLIDRRPARV